MEQIEAGFRRTLRKQGRNLMVLSAGVSSGTIFRATINRIGAYTLAGEIGEDPRGKRVMEILAAGAPVLASQNELADTKNGERFKITTIGLDCPAYSQKFELQQMVKGKDF